MNVDDSLNHPMMQPLYFAVENLPGSATDGPGP